MIWETLAAIFLLLAAFPLWLVAAWAWGLVVFVFTFTVSTIAALISSDAGWEQIWVVPLAAIISALEAAWSVPAWIWNWAKFEHPWWAFFIALILSGLFSGNARR